jgi:hypothetical protein
MCRVMVRVALLMCATVPLAGCGLFDLGPSGGPAYQLDSAKVGTGQQAITPRNDSSYWNGQPMDYRQGR